MYAFILLKRDAMINAITTSGFVSTTVAYLHDLAKTEPVIVLAKKDPKPKAPGPYSTK